jgi:hypothetical protein
MAMLRCPHCQCEIELRIKKIELRSIGPGGAVATPEKIGAYSTSVRVDQAQPQLATTEYHPNPTKLYRTSEAQRRAGLARYYQNRKKILQRAYERRQARRAGAA